MAGLWPQPNLEFGVRVVRAAGLDLDPADQRRPQLEGGGGGLFVRYYVPAGDGTRRLRVDTREVPCGGEASWGEHARFERWGRGAAADAGSTPAAPGGTIVFELRWRPPPSSSYGLVAAFLEATTGKGRRRPPSSRVLARAELAWHDVLAASTKPAERWLKLAPAGRELSGCKAPQLLVEVDVAPAGAVDHVVVRERRAAGVVGECCSAGEHCGQCGWVGSEEDMFLAATFSH